MSYHPFFFFVIFFSVNLKSWSLSVPVPKVPTRLKQDYFARGLKTLKQLFNHFLIDGLIKQLFSFNGFTNVEEEI